MVALRRVKLYEQVAERLEARIRARDLAPLLADAIKRIHFNESVSKLFD